MKEKKENIPHTPHKRNKSPPKPQENLSNTPSGYIDPLPLQKPGSEHHYNSLSVIAPYQLLVENMGMAALLVSKDGTILYSTPGFLEMSGYPSEEIIGKSLMSLVEPKDVSYLTGRLNKEEKKNSELHLVTKEQKILSVLFSIFEVKWKGIDALSILMTDITELKKAQQLIQVSESITKILSETLPITQTFKAILEVLHKFFGWEVLIIWVWDKEDHSLVCENITHIPEVHIDSFINKTKEIRTRKMLMNSIAWSSYRPCWIRDVTEDSSFARRNEAIECDLHGVLAFPFYEESYLCGVIELFRKQPFNDEVDDLLLNLITSIGIEIGLYFQRKTTKLHSEHISKLIDNSVDGIFGLNLHAIIKSWNPGAEKIYGWKANEIIGQDIKIIFPEDRLSEYEKLKKLLSQGKSLDRYEAERRRKDGKLIWVQNTLGTIKNENDECTGASVVVRDITDQKAVKESLVQTNEKFQTFIELTKEWVWEMDKEGYYRFSNQAVTKILGYEIDEIIGKNILYFLPTGDRDKMEQLLKENVIEKQGWTNRIIRFLRKDGNECWIESNATEMHDSKHKFCGFRGINLDITEAKNLEKIKNEFISIVNHELRTPLTSVYGALSLLMKKETTPKEKEELIAIAQRNSERLTSIINDIMDIEKLQLGKLDFNMTKLNLRDIVLESVRSSSIHARKFEVNINIEEPLPDAYVMGDHIRLVQVMMNLLSNAIKFSPNGGEIEISMSSTEDTVKVSVKDEGPGIPKEFQPKLFAKFAQADSSSQRAYQGTGLGLHICRSIIEGHNGKILFKTEIGKGTTFYIELPKYKES
jgi:PAS domain S-box-containing protein